jgi:hypothetical protein
MTDRAPPTWEQVLELARRIAGGEVGDPELTAKRLAALVLDFQAHVVHGHDTPAASTTRPAVSVGSAKQR